MPSRLKVVAILPDVRPGRTPPKSCPSCKSPGSSLDPLGQLVFFYSCGASYRNAAKNPVEFACKTSKWLCVDPCPYPNAKHAVKAIDDLPGVLAAVREQLTVQDLATTGIDNVSYTPDGPVGCSHDVDDCLAGAEEGLKHRHG